MRSGIKKILVGISVVLIAALVTAIVFTGCASAPQPTTPAPTTSTPTAKPVEGARIAFLLPNVGPWYNDKWYGFEDEAKKLGMVPTMYSAGGYGNVNKQVSQLEDAIAAGYDGIVLHATSGSALVPSVKKALEAGIYVSTEHSPLSEAIVPNVWEGPAEAGRVLAMYMANDIGGAGKVLLINGPPGQMESLAEEEGMVWVFDNFYPEIQYVREWPAPEVAQLLKVTEDLLTANPDTKAIYNWGGPYIEGVVEALKAAGLEPGEIKVYTSYAMPSTGDALMEGWVECMTVGAPLAVGRMSAQNMAKMLRGETVPLEINVPQVAVTKASVNKFDFSGCYWEE